MKRFIMIFSVVAILATSAVASTIIDIKIDTGSWDGAAFAQNGLRWTNYTPSNWAVGVTAPTWGSPLLNPAGSLSVADGQYYLFMDGRDLFTGSFNAIQITIDSRLAVFLLSAPGAYSGPGYSLVSGGGFSADAITPPATQDLVGQLQSYAPDGMADWVVGIDSSVPEPGAWTLTLAGMSVLFLSRFIRRRRLQQPSAIG